MAVTWVRRTARVATVVALFAALAVCAGRDHVARAGGTRAMGQTAMQDVTFTSGRDTVSGTLLLPMTAANARVPAAIIISGSGPTDRDGNTPLIEGDIGTNRNIANALLGAGVASLRYDKLGTGATGLGGHTLAEVAAIDFETYVQEALDALAYVRARPEIDPARVLVVGHSEGTLIALVVADRLRDAGEPAGLILAAPLGERYLDTIRRQLVDPVDAAVAAGAAPRDVADAQVAELDSVIASIRTTGRPPAYVATPALRALFNPGVSVFLADVDRYDPPVIAASLPPTLPVLILRGSKDQQVSGNDVARVLDGFRTGGNTGVTAREISDANHVFKIVPGQPNPSIDYGNPDLPFASEAAALIEQFVRTTLSP